MTAQTVSSAVATRDSGPVAVMWSKKTHLDAVLPDSIDVKAFLGTAAGALYASKTLMDYATANPDSLIIALMECAALGHMPGTDEYYLTPRKQKGRPSVLGIEGYKGVIERMYRSGAVAKVVVREVCAADPFDYVEGRDAVPLHEIGGRGGTGAAFFGEQGSRKRGQMVGAYAYAELTTGAVSRVVILTRDDVFAARESGGWKPDDEYSPWNRLDGGSAHPEFTGRSMWWKTAAKRLEPWVPTSREYRVSMLSASAKAAELAGPRPAAPGLPPADSGILDAELVDTPEDASPAEGSGPPAAAPAVTPAQAAGEASAPSSSGQRSQICTQVKRFGPDPDTEEGWAVVLRVTARLMHFAAIADLSELTDPEAAKVIRELKGMDARTFARLTADENGEMAAPDGEASDG